MLAYGLLVIAIFFVGYMAYATFTSIRYGHTLKDTVSTRGMNGSSGQTVQLSCPAGQAISFQNSNTTMTRGALTCGGSDSTAGCDAFWSTNGQYTNFFTPNIVDTLASGSPFSDLTSLSGKNSGSWVVPSPSDSRVPSSSCVKGCSSLNFIGTYDCVAAT